MTFQFPTRRVRSRRQRQPYAVNPETPQEEELTGLVQGLSATSNEEYVAMALDQVGLDYDFQYPILGGRRVLGGFVVDFLVYVPFGDPLEVYGEYWHEGQFGEGDKLKEAIIFAKFGRPAKIIWGNESDTREKALASVRRLYG